jgi:hypothetical protein
MKTKTQISAFQWTIIAMLGIAASIGLHFVNTNFLQGAFVIDESNIPSDSKLIYIADISAEVGDTPSFPVKLRTDEPISGWSLSVGYPEDLEGLFSVSLNSTLESTYFDNFKSPPGVEHDAENNLFKIYDAYLDMSNPVQIDAGFDGAIIDFNFTSALSMTEVGTHSLEVNLATGNELTNVQDIYGEPITFQVHDGSLTIPNPDGGPPILVMPPEITLQASTINGEVYSMDITATDDLSLPSNITIDCSSTGVLTPNLSESGNSALEINNITYPLGTTLVNCTATDEVGNTSAPAATRVIIHDLIAPTITMPADETLSATDNDGTINTYVITATDNIYPANQVNIDCSIIAGGNTIGSFSGSSPLNIPNIQFPIGSTLISCTATDPSGNNSSGYRMFVVVEDDIAPVITTTNQNINATGPSGATTTFSPTAIDNVDGDVSANISCAPHNSGDTFPIGVTTVNCFVDDAAGNTGNSSFTITVVAAGTPVINVPSNITIEATGPSGASTTFTVTASDTEDGNITPNCDATSGDTFPLGTTTVSCSATDSGTNIVNGSFDIIVVDTTPPIITSNNISLDAINSNGAPATFSPTATDIVDGNLTGDIVCDQTSGAIFPIGVTTVNCTVDDAAGNTGNKSFTITVNDNLPPAGVFELLIRNLDDDTHTLLIEWPEVDDADTYMLLAASMNDYVDFSTQTYLTEIPCNSINLDQVGSSFTGVDTPPSGYGAIPFALVQSGNRLWHEADASSFNYAGNTPRDMVYFIRAQRNNGTSGPCSPVGYMVGDVITDSGSSSVEAYNPSEIPKPDYRVTARDSHRVAFSVYGPASLELTLPMLTLAADVYTAQGTPENYALPYTNSTYAPDGNVTLTDGHALNESTTSTFSTKLP